jgi:hypothetical protein
VTPEREGQLPVVIGIVRQQPLQDRRARMDLALLPVEPFDLVAEHVRRPSIQHAVDDREARVQGTDQLSGVARVREVVLPALVGR